jgi:hypothetical protein
MRKKAKIKNSGKSSGILQKFKIAACFCQIAVVFCSISKDGASGPGNTGHFFRFFVPIFFLYPLVSDYQKSKFGGPIFDLPILLKSDILFLFSVIDQYRISEDR